MSNPLAEEGQMLYLLIQVIICDIRVLLHIHGGWIMLLGVAAQLLVSN